MKNICLIVGDGLQTCAAEGLPLTELIGGGGYELTETRILHSKTPDTVKAALIDCKSGYDNTFLLCSRRGMAFAHKTLEEVFNKEFFQGSESGAGLYFEEGKALCILPLGDEGKEYLLKVCLPALDKRYGLAHAKFTMRFVGAAPEKIQGLAQAAEEYSGGRLRVISRRAYGEDTVEILYDNDTPKMLTDEVVRRFVEELGESLYALDNTSLEEQLIQLLKLRGKKIAVAESFTGGGVGRRLVSVAGASKVFVEGLNTYAVSSKQKRLGVSEYTLQSYGAVSPQTAYEMAAGLLRGGDAQVAIATTGLAGPESDESGLPVGTCCIAVGVDDKIFVSRYRLEGNRRQITETAVNYALFLACKQLKNM